MGTWGVRTATRTGVIESHANQLPHDGPLFCRKQCKTRRCKYQKSGLRCTSMSACQHQTDNQTASMNIGIHSNGLWSLKAVHAGVPISQVSHQNCDLAAILFMLIRWSKSKTQLGNRASRFQHTLFMLRRTCDLCIA